MSKDENVKTIRFPVKTDEKLQSLAGKCGLTKLDLFMHMVDYFYKTKKDPRDLNDELLKNSINRKTDNIVAFIRMQEKELLVPVKKETEHILTMQAEMKKLFEGHIITHNERQEKILQTMLDGVAKMNEQMSQMSKSHLEKLILKKRATGILEYYIQNREQMSVLTKQIEKDELIRHVREQMVNL